MTVDFCVTTREQNTDPTITVYFGSLIDAKGFDVFVLATVGYCIEHILYDRISMWVSEKKLINEAHISIKL